MVHIKNRVIEIKESPVETPGEILELEQEKVEIRTVIESDPQYGIVPVKKEYMVHKVDGMKDTLFQISYKYNVPKKVIQ